MVTLEDESQLIAPGWTAAITLLAILFAIAMTAILYFKTPETSTNHSQRNVAPSDRTNAAPFGLNGDSSQPEAPTDGKPMTPGPKPTETGSPPDALPPNNSPLNTPSRPGP